MLSGETLCNPSEVSTFLFISIEARSYGVAPFKLSLMIKIEDEDGEIRTIRQIQVHFQEKKNYAGIPSEEYDCTIVILGQKVPVKLVHYLTESRWVMNFK